MKSILTVIKRNITVGQLMNKKALQPGDIFGFESDDSISGIKFLVIKIGKAKIGLNRIVKDHQGFIYNFLRLEDSVLEVIYYGYEDHTKYLENINQQDLDK